MADTLYIHIDTGIGQHDTLQSQTLTSPIKAFSIGLVSSDSVASTQSKAMQCILQDTK